MKKNFFIIAAVVCGMSCTTTAYAQFKIGGKKINVTKAVQAGTDAIKAISLSDADIAAMSKEYMEWMDTHNPLTKPDTDYGKRLEKLTGNIKEVDGLKVNFGVYEVIDVNAFACGDGSCRPRDRSRHPYGFQGCDEECLPSFGCEECCRRCKFYGIQIE